MQSISRKEAIKILKDLSDCSHIGSLASEDIEALNMAIKALEREPKLQNRCYALTHGQLCVFCPYECEHKAKSEEE